MTCVPAEAIAIAREVQKQRPKESIGFVLEGDIQATKKAWPEAVTAYRAGLKQVGSSDLAIRLHDPVSIGIRSRRRQTREGPENRRLPGLHLGSKPHQNVDFALMC